MRLALAALSLLAGCAGPAVVGTVHERVAIGPSERIAVLWSIGTFQSPQLMDGLAKAGVNGKPYQQCTNALVEATFRANGYDARAFRSWPGVRPELPPGTRYVLTLANTSVRSPQVRTLGGPELIGDLQLNMQVDLLDARTRKKLWSAPGWLFSDAKANAVPLVHLVRALAADGYLAVAPGDVADHTGARGRAESQIEQRCPA
jgi:hypothetical protein